MYISIKRHIFYYCWWFGNWYTWNWLHYLHNDKRLYSCFVCLYVSLYLKDMNCHFNFVKCMGKLKTCLVGKC